MLERFSPASYFITVKMLVSPFRVALEYWDRLKWETLSHWAGFITSSGSFHKSWFLNKVEKWSKESC